jgi:hypothetical protein
MAVHDLKLLEIADKAIRLDGGGPSRRGDGGGHWHHESH